MHVSIAALHRPTQPTGVCRHAINLAQCLVVEETVDRVTLIIGDWQTDYFKTAFDLSSDKIKLEIVTIENKSVSRNLWYLFGLPRLAKRLATDILHLSFPLPFVRRWFRMPIAATIHDLYPYEYPENFGYPQVLFNQKFLDLCIRGSDGLCCVSNTTRTALEHYFPLSRSQKSVTVIYNYVDFGKPTLTVPEPFDISYSPHFILCVAQHRKNKNIDILIESYARLIKTDSIHSDITLIIVGSSGPETKHLHQLIEMLDLRKKVIFMSALKDSELCWLYDRCALFVIPSSTEGFCLPLIEALSFSCRVVCSDIPIFREVGSSYCQYFNLQSNPIQSLADTITKSLSQSGNGKQPFHMDNRFSRTIISKQIFSFYKTLF